MRSQSHRDHHSSCFEMRAPIVVGNWGLSAQTVRKRLIEADVDTRARLRVLSDEDLRAARAAMDNGASVREIARGLGVAHTTVTRSLARPHETPASPLHTTPEISSDQGKREKQTGPSTEMLGQDLGSLRSTFANLTPRLKTLVTRWKRGVYRVSQRPETVPMEDCRGTVVRRIEHLQTFLTTAEVNRLVDDYLNGTRVNKLEDRHGVHRATVSAHLTRRCVGRRPGLGAEEAAEVVRHLDAGDRTPDRCGPQGGTYSVGRGRSPCGRRPKLHGGRLAAPLRRRVLWLTPVVASVKQRVWSCESWWA